MTDLVAAGTPTDGARRTAPHPTRAPGLDRERPVHCSGTCSPSVLRVQPRAGC
ncbi:hypothetical protein QJS66_01395 [Kocuria rhizophila]|nr:hypothetical protein QJS66_01395 [Kocuria rhizophila]